MLDPITQQYIGDELRLFEAATNWKKYYGSILKPYLKGRVLEVGAGLGGTTIVLCDGSPKEWTCLEPDATLSAEIQTLIDNHQLPTCCKVVTGTFDNLQKDEFYDCIIYIDVIEHIKDDRNELEKAYSKLTKGGHLIILAPAYQFLYNAFDKEIGHFRRYNKKRLKSVIPPNLKPVRLNYLDSVGVMASVFNKFFLQQKYPTPEQIKLWDNYLIRTSMVLDKLIFHQWGKSLLGIWEK